MIVERNIGLCVVLSLVTCGIYYIYWLVVVVDDLNRAAETPNDTNGMIVFLLSLVTCGIYEIYWAYKAGAKLLQAQNMHGMPGTDQSIVFLVLTLLLGVGGIIVLAMIQTELNKMATPMA